MKIIFTLNVKLNGGQYTCIQLYTGIQTNRSQWQKDLPGKKIQGYIWILTLRPVKDNILNLFFGACMSIYVQCI